MKNTPPGCSTLPSRALSALTASALNSPLVCASGEPPMMATEGLISASSRASRSTRDAATPVICSTCSGAKLLKPGRPAVDERSGAPAGARRPQLRGHDHVRQPEREHAFGPRLHRHPLIGVRTGLRHPRLDLHEHAADSGTALPHQPVAMPLRRRRVPRAEEVGAEAEDVSRIRQIERGQLLAAEAERVGAPQHIVVEQLVGDGAGCAIRREEPIDERGAMAVTRASQERQRLLVACRREPVEPRHEFRDAHRPRRSRRTCPVRDSPLRFSGCVMRSG